MKEFINSFINEKVARSFITMFVVFMVIACIGEMIWGGPKFEDYFFFWMEPSSTSNIVGILHQKPLSGPHAIYQYFVYFLGPIISLIWHGAKTTARALVFSVIWYIYAFIVLCLIVLFAILFGGKKKK